MEFCQTRTYGGFDLSYELIYSLDDSDNAIHGTLTVNAGDSWDTLESQVSYEFTDELDGELKMKTSEEDRLIFSVEVQYSDDETSGKFLLDIVDNHSPREETLHIQLPSIYILQLYGRLLQEEVPVQAHSQLEDILSENQVPTNLEDVLKSAPYAVSRINYFKLHNRILAYDESLTNRFHSTIISEFTDWIRNKSSGKYYTIDSISELQDLADKYNEYQHTPILEVPVLDAIIKYRSDYIGRGLDGFLVDDFGNSDFPYYDLSIEVFVLAIGYLAHEQDLNHLSNDFATHVRESDEIVDDIDDCLNGTGESVLDCFRSNVPNFANDGDIETVRYGIARLIRRYVISESDSLTFATRAYLYGSIVSLCADTPAAWLAEHARHHRHLELAEDARKSDPDRALHHYDQAIVILTQSEDWDPSTNEYVWVVFRKTLHEAETLVEDGLYEEAANKLAEREEVIQEIGDSSEDSLTSTVVDQLNGHQNELRADKYLEQDQLERARELYNQAAGHYRRANRDGLFKGIKGREIQIDALIAEISGEFEEAANLHQRYAETLPDSAGSKFHRIRHDICLAKSAAIRQEYEEAEDWLSGIESKYNTELDPAQRQFRQILQAAQNFQQQEQDEIENHLESFIASLGEDEERLLNFSDDYTTGHLTVLAAQRLQSLPVEKQTLEDLIDIAIQDACFPKAPAEQIKGPDRPYTSPTAGESREWELSLPSHIINQLDQLRIDKQTTFDEFAPLVQQLGVITEQLLRILWEYHAKQYWGTEWTSQVPGEGDSTIGDLYQFFKSDAGRSLNAANDVIRLFETEIVGEKLIKELRDALAHGRNPNVTGDTYRQINEEQFDQIYNTITDVFRIITTDLPVLGMVDSQLSMNTYKISLKWGGLPKQIWITTEHELETGKLYFFPRSEFDKDYEKTVTVSAKTIECCESDTRTHYFQEQ